MYDPLITRYGLPIIRCDKKQVEMNSVIPDNICNPYVSRLKVPMLNPIQTSGNRWQSVVQARSFIISTNLLYIYFQIASSPRGLKSRKPAFNHQRPIKINGSISVLSFKPGSITYSGCGGERNDQEVSVTYFLQTACRESH
jgi:hypothetical protein